MPRLDHFGKDGANDEKKNTCKKLFRHIRVDAPICLEKIPVVVMLILKECSFM